MRFVYNGKTYGKLACPSLQEAREIVRSGQWFKTEKLGWFCRGLSYETGTHTEFDQDVALIERMCATSKHSKTKFFFRLVEVENSKIYTGDDLVVLIGDELQSWGLNLKPSTMTAFSGKHFESFLSAIPPEIFAPNYEYFKSRLTDGLSRHITRTKDTLQKNELRERKKQIISQMQSLAQEYGEEGQDLYDKATATFEKRNPANRASDDEAE